MNMVEFCKVGGYFEAFSESAGKNQLIIRCLT